MIMRSVDGIKTLDTFSSWMNKYHVINWFFMRVRFCGVRKPTNSEKNPSDQGENQYKFKPHIAPGRNWTRATLAEGERTHHCVFVLWTGSYSSPYGRNFRLFVRDIQYDYLFQEGGSRITIFQFWKETAIGGLGWNLDWKSKYVFFAYWYLCGNLMARSTPDRAVRIRALAEDLVLYSSATHSTQVYKWVLANFLLGSNPTID